MRMAAQGVLLQIFTQPLSDRPTVFLEIIQRIGCTSPAQNTDGTPALTSKGEPRLVQAGTSQASNTHVRLTVLQRGAQVLV